MMTQAGLRRAVFQFLSTTTHPLKETWKQNFENMTGMKWQHYWSYKYMLRSGIWADEIFIRGTAYYLNMDIVIHQNRDPVIERISGNMENENIPCANPELHVGYLFSLHYQSILPRSQVNRNFKIKEENEELQDPLKEKKSEERAVSKKYDEEEAEKLEGM